MNMGGGLGRVSNHSEHYYSDGSVSFLTHKTLFRVHRSFFERESQVFRDLFRNAVEDDPQAGSDARPFTIEDVKPEDFADFLWVWYDRDYLYARQTKEKWLTILRLATRWEFNKIKELAVRELEALELPPAERISIYNEYGIDGERVVSSFVEMCKSPTVPTEADARFLQMEALIKLLQAREEARNKAAEMGHESPTSASLEDGVLREVVSKVLREGLDSHSGGPSTGLGDQALHEQTTTNSTVPKLKQPLAPNRRETNGVSSQQTNETMERKPEEPTKVNGTTSEGGISEEEKEKQRQKEEKKQRDKEAKRLRKEAEAKHNQNPTQPRGP